MPERPLPVDRISDLIGRETELHLLMDPRRLITPNAVDAQYGIEERARVETTQQLHQLLTLYAVASHAALTDAMNHPEDLLLPKPKPRMSWLKKKVAGINDFLNEYPHNRHKVQFALEDENPQAATFVTLQAQKTKLQGIDELICSGATFVRAAKLYTPDLSQDLHYMGITIARKKYQGVALSKEVYMHGVPSTYDYMTHFEFDDKGRIRIILHHTQDTQASKTLTWYEIDERDFSADHLDERSKVTFGMFSPYNGRSSRYAYCEDGRFREEPVDEDTPTIEEELLTILTRLPIQDKRSLQS